MSRGRGCLAEVNSYSVELQSVSTKNYNTRSFMSLKRRQILFCKTDRFAEVVVQAVSIKHGLRTGYTIRTRCKTRTGKYGLGIKHGLGIKRGLQAADWV